MSEAGTIGILNVGTGDTKLSFDRNNPAECIRAARIVTDMLRRGYALLIEVERHGEKAFERVREFREDTCEYIIADFDPVAAEKADSEDEGRGHAKIGTEAAGETAADAAPASRKTRGRKGARTRAVAASGTRGIAVARTAGG